MAQPAHQPTSIVPQTSLAFPTVPTVTEEEFVKLRDDYGFMNKADITKDADGKFYWKGQQITAELIAFLDDKDADGHGGPSFRS